MIEWNDMMSVFDTGANKKAKDKNNKSIKKNIATSINIKDLMGSEL